MSKFSTCMDRYCKATGGESNIDWATIGTEAGQAILDYIKTGVGSSTVEGTADNTQSQEQVYAIQCPYGNRQITIFGKTLPVYLALKYASVALQIVSIFVAIAIASKVSRCKC